MSACPRGGKLGDDLDRKGEGCLASYYLATWILARTAGRDVAAEVLGYVAPVGEQAAWIERAFAAIGPYL